MERAEVGKGSPVHLLVPGERFTRFAAPAITKRALIALTLAILLGLAAGPVGAATADPQPAQSVQDELSKFGALAPAAIDDLDSPADLAPDVTILVELAGSPSDSWWAGIRDTLEARSEVEAVSVDFPGDAATAFHLRLADTELRHISVGELSDELSRSVENMVAEQSGRVAVTAGGRALTDEVITDRYGTTVRWLGVLSLLLAGYVAWRFGRRRGAVVGLAWLGAVVLSGRIASRVVGPFDGTIATGPLVGAMAGLAFAVVVGLRLVKWYENPDSTDGADAVARSLAEVASDVILVLGSLLAVVGVLWIAGGSSRPLVAVIVGGLVGATFTGAIVAAALALFAAADDRRNELLPWTVPTGGQLMVITVVGLIALLLVLGAFSFRSPGRDFIDYRALPSADQSRLVGDLLGAGPGDPTEALVTVVDDSSAEATATWAEAVATLSNVAWVDTADRRFTGGGSTEVDPALSLAAPEQIGFESEELAVIVPAVAIRSPEGGLLIDDVTRLADERVEIVGAAGPLERGSTLVVLAAIVLLALAGAGSVLVETDNAGYALTSFLLRLLGGAATVGLYRLISPDAFAAEAIAALALVAVVVSLFELEFLHDRARFGDRWSTSAGLVTVAHEPALTTPAANGVNGANGAAVVDDVLVADDGGDDTAVPALNGTGSPAALESASPGRAGLLAALALIAASLFAALTRFLGGGPTVGRFGFALAVALIIEVALGFLVLRPALLGEQAVYHSVARPLRSTLHAGQRRQRGQPVSVDDPAWRRLVTDLLMAEFGLQTDPDTTRVEQVFLEGTPLFGQAVEQHRSLSGSGLRVSGRAPQIRQVETFREGPSIMVSVTVDHPERHLVDYEGSVYGLRRAQRRSTMLWLVGLDTGEVRIAESIDMGSVPLDVDKTPDKTSFPEVATVSG